MSVSMMEDFFESTNKHSVLCGAAPTLVKRCNRQGAAMKWTYQCPNCCEELVLDSSPRIRTKVVAQGATRSRLQPAINVQIAQGMTEAGVNTQKTQEFLCDTLSIKIAKDDNLRNQQTKVRAGINSIFEERKVENRKKAVAARRELATAENLNWSKDGVAHSTICGDISIDGAGATRSYGKGYKGSCAAANAIDRVTGLPLDVLTSQVGNTFSCS